MSPGNGSLMIRDSESVTSSGLLASAEVPPNSECESINLLIIRVRMFLSITRLLLFCPITKEVVAVQVTGEQFARDAERKR